MDHSSVKQSLVLTWLLTFSLASVYLPVSSIAWSQNATPEQTLKPFKEGNLLVVTRKLLLEFDIEGNKIQEYIFPRRSYDDERTFYENFVPTAVTCDDQGIAWMSFEAERIEVEPEKFVEWQYKAFGFATLDSKTGKFEIKYIPEISRKRGYYAKTIELDKAGLIIEKNGLMLLDPQSGEVKKTIPIGIYLTRSPDGELMGGVRSKRARRSRDKRSDKNLIAKFNARKFKYAPISGRDLSPVVFAIDENGNRYEKSKDDFLIVTKQKTHTLNLKRDLKIQSLIDLDFHPSGQLIMTSNLKEILILQPNPDKGTIEIVRKIKLKSFPENTCVVGKQN